MIIILGEEKVVVENGSLRCIYSDRLLPYIKAISARLRLKTTMTRASHVEPCNDDAVESDWYVDLSPMGGPEYVVTDEEGHPFTARQQALEYERRWLETNFLGIGGIARC